MYFEKVFKAIFIWTCFKIGMWTASNNSITCVYINCTSMFCSVHRCTSMYINRNWDQSHFVSALKCPLEASKYYLPSVWWCQGERIVFFFISKQQGFKERNKLKFESRIAFCAPASYRGQILCQLCQILCLSNYIKFTSLQPNQKHCSWWPEAPRDLSWIDPGHI